MTDRTSAGGDAPDGGPGDDRPIDPATARRYVAGHIGLFALTLGHALLTWPLPEAAALFLGGVIIAFAAEAPSIRAGLFTHYLRPTVAGVPVSILLAWPAVVYLAVRVASLGVDGAVPVAATAAVLATLADALVEPGAVEDGAWAYSERIPGPRPYGVPWWNAAGWLVIVFLTALLPAAV
ncbi:carotenoid biosynthesis protein [Halolamina litorea]|uniref:Carotenoid biosynthesis protein n=1 Tax=Halolamina litorea TaxID=1515593 RepID=A0ABD6BTQ1_9EURY|nr:carotenoid biosynthesis protein [Halolamina litorea]